MTGAQGIIMIAAHLYNAAHKSGLLPSDTMWADMDWLVEEQGSRWMFVGKRPEKLEEFLFHASFAFGESITLLAKDATGKKNSWEDDFRRHNATHTISKKGENLVRRLRFIPRSCEVYAQRDHRTEKLTETGRGRGASGEFDIVVLTELLVQDYLNEGRNTKHTAKGDLASAMSGTQNMTAVETLTIFKNAMKKDEFPYGFNIMALYLRCIKMLGRIYEHLHEHVPVTYPRDLYSNGLDITTMVRKMFSELAGMIPVDGFQFRTAVQFLREVIDKEGDAESAKAKERMPTEMEQEHVESSFENPEEDNFPMWMRQFAGTIMIADDDGAVRMPFRY
jgi:hypothetical protein